MRYGFSYELKRLRKQVKKLRKNQREDSNDVANLYEDSYEFNDRLNELNETVTKLGWTVNGNEVNPNLGQKGLEQRVEDLENENARIAAMDGKILSDLEVRLVKLEEQDSERRQQVTNLDSAHTRLATLVERLEQQVNTLFGESNNGN